MPASTLKLELSRVWLSASKSSSSNSCKVESYTNVSTVTYFGVAPSNNRPEPTSNPLASVTPRSVTSAPRARSEERRVGKECRARWWPYQEDKKTQTETTAGHNTRQVERVEHAYTQSNE